VLRFNQGQCEEKYVRLRQAMGLAPGADLAEAIEGMNRAIGIPSGLGEMGITEGDIPEMIAYAQKDLAARSNPRRASDAEFEAMIREAF
jgi:4-hydroxybutyrate dehydrogenase